LGGVIDGLISRPRDDRVHVSGYADLVNAGGLVETPIEQTGTNVTIAGRYSYTGWLIERMADLAMGGTAGSSPELAFWDYGGRIEQRLPNAGRLRLLAIGASDTIGNDFDDPTMVDAAMRELFHRVDLRYQQPLPLGEAEIGFTWGHDELGIDGRQNNKTIADYKLRTNLVRARAAWNAALNAKWEISAGADIEHRRAANTLFVGLNTGGAGASAYTAPLTLATLSGLYAQAQWRPVEAFSVTAGLRGDLWHLFPRIDHASLDPRVSMRYSPRPNLTFKAGAALVHQSPAVLLNVPVLDVAFLRNGIQEAVSAETGVDWAPLSGYEISVDAYYTHITRALELDLFQLLQNFRTLGLVGRRASTWGRAYGVEVMVRHPIGQNWFGWISYSLQRSTRYETFTRFDENMNPLERVSAELPYAFDQTHILNAAVSYKFPGDITAGVVLHFNTGRPESGKISSRTRVPWTDPADGKETWRSVNRDQIERLPPFFRIDARIAKRFVFSDFTLEGYLDFLNASLSGEVLGYSYLDEETWPDGTHQAAERRSMTIPVVLPMLGLKGAY
jgi:outer membrane receptor protein involved in Fe transport